MATAQATIDFSKFKEESEAAPVPETTGEKATIDFNQFKEQAPTPASKAPVAPEEEDLPETNGLRNWLKEFQNRNATGVTDTIASLTGLEQQQGDILGIGAPRGVGIGEAAVQLTGAGISGIGDALFSGVSALTPQPVKDVLSSGLKTAFEALQSTEIGAKGIELAQEGGAKWAAFAKAYPQEAKTIGAAIEIGLMALPAKRLMPNSYALKNRGRKLEYKGKKEIEAKQEEGLRDVIRPPDTDLGVDELSEQGLFQYQEWVPSPKDEELLGVLRNVEGINPKKSAAYNAPLIQRAVEKEASRLHNELNRLGNPEVDKASLYTAFEDVLENIDSLPQAELLTGDARDPFIRMVKRAKGLVEKSDGTAAGVLEARRSFDKWLTENSPSIFDVSNTTAQKVAKTAVRNLMNDAVAKAVPKARVRRSLDKQHQLLTLRDRAVDRRNRQGKTRFDRAREKGLAKGLHLPTTPLALYATGSTGLAAAGALGMGLTAATTGLLGLGTAGLYKLAKSPQGKVAIGKALQEVSKAMKGSKGPHLPELRAKRLALLGALQGQGETEQ